MLKVVDSTMHAAHHPVECWTRQELLPEIQNACQYCSRSWGSSHWYRVSTYPARQPHLTTRRCIRQPSHSDSEIQMIRWNDSQTSTDRSANESHIFRYLSIFQRIYDIEPTSGGLAARICDGVVGETTSVPGSRCWNLLSSREAGVPPQNLGKIFAKALHNFSEHPKDVNEIRPLRVSHTPLELMELLAWALGSQAKASLDCQSLSVLWPLEIDCVVDVNHFDVDIGQPDQRLTCSLMCLLKWDFWVAIVAEYLLYPQSATTGSLPLTVPESPFSLPIFAIASLSCIPNCCPKIKSSHPGHRGQSSWFLHTHKITHIRIPRASIFPRHRAPRRSPGFLDRACSCPSTIILIAASQGCDDSWARHIPEFWPKTCLEGAASLHTAAPTYQTCRYHPRF